MLTPGGTASGYAYDHGDRRRSARDAHSAVISAQDALDNIMRKFINDLPYRFDRYYPKGDKIGTVFGIYDTEMERSVAARVRSEAQFEKDIRALPFSTTKPRKAQCMPSGVGGGKTSRP